MHIAYTTYDSNWDKIFGKKKEDKVVHVEHKRSLQIMDRVSEHWSDDGKRSAILYDSNNGYRVECYERSRMMKEIDLSGKSLYYAEDACENWCLGIPE